MDVIRGVDDDMKKMTVIFGSGQAGAEALYFIGQKNVLYFCDNRKELQDNEKYGIPIIGFEKLLHLKEDYILLIAANVVNAMQIAEQLESRGISDYLFFYDEVKNMLLQVGAEETLNYYAEERHRLHCKANFFYKQSLQQMEQILYLKNEIDAFSLKKATGFLRGEQRRHISFLQEMISVIKKLNIYPFAVGGTLIGVKRHKGFVPWDDDIDFGISRRDYNVLFSFASKHWHIVKREYFGVENYRQMNQWFSMYPNENIFVIMPYCSSVMQGTSIAEYKIIDFFIFDYFDEGYPFTEYKKVIQQTKARLEGNHNEIQRLELEQSQVKENEHIVSESNHISYALDSMMAYDHLHNQDWIDRKIIYPTVYTEFDGIKIPVPNNIDKFLEYDIPNYKGLPTDVAVSNRLTQRGNAIRNILPVVEFYLTKVVEIDYLQPIYQELRDEKVYAIFVIEPSHCNLADCVETERIEQILIDRELEYAKWIDREARIAVAYNAICLKDYGEGSKKLFFNETTSRAKLLGAIRKELNG